MSSFLQLLLVLSEVVAQLVSATQTDYYLTVAPAVLLDIQPGNHVLHLHHPPSQSHSRGSAHPPKPLDASKDDRGRMVVAE